MPSLLLSTFLATLSLSSAAAAAAASCSRPLLENITTAYVAAQKAGNPTLLTALISPHPNQIYLENNQVTVFANSTLSGPLKIDFTRSIHDPDECATFTELIAATDAHPRVIHTRILVDTSLQKASLVESVVTDRGDWLFNATGTLELNAGERWDVIAEAERAGSRAAVQALGDAYFDRFGNASVVVPWAAEPCYRLEGGLPARGEVRAGECVMVFPDTIKIPYRRYVVDVTMGAASLFIGFPGLDRTQGDAPMPDSHLFRVEGGKIKYIHTASACVVEGCGLNSTTPPGRKRGLRPAPLRV